MTLVTVKAKENLIDGLTDKAVYKGGLFKMESERAKENAELGYLEIVDGNPDLNDKPKREVGTFTVENIKPAEPEKIIQPIKKEEATKEVDDSSEEKEDVTEVKRGRKPKTD